MSNYYDIVYQREKIIDEYGETIKKGEPFEIKNCFPEFDLKPPFTFLPFELKIFHVLPFYRNLIIDLYPYENEQKFISEYGVSVKDLIKIFEENNNLFLRVEGPLPLYSKLDYLKPVFDLNPPNSDRFDRVYSIVNKKTYENSFNSMAAVLQHFKQITAFNPSDSMEKNLEKMGRVNVYTNTYCHLLRMHGPSVADEILEFSLNPPNPHINPWIFFKETFKTYAKCSIFPKTKSLGGPHLMSNNTYLSARALQITPDQMGIQFPFDIDTAFLKPMNLQMPRDLDIAFEIDAKKWQNALINYEDAIKKRQIKEIRTRAEAIQIENKEINQTLDEMDSGQRRISKQMHRISDGLEILFLLGGLGKIEGFSEIQTVSGIASGLNFIGKKFIDTSADAYVKFKKSDQVCFIYSINKKIESKR